MKKLIILATAALLAMSVSAQKGSMYLGLTGIGNSEMGTGVIISSQGDYSTTSWGLAPEFGYFVSDNLAIGAVVGIGGAAIKDNPGDNPFAFRLSPYGRYFLIQDSGFGFYLQGGIDFLSESESVLGPKNSLFGIGINPGISYNVGPFTATAAFGWLGFQTYSEDGVDDNLNSFGLNVNMASLKFGLSYNF